MTTAEKQKNILAVWEERKRGIHSLQKNFIAKSGQGHFFQGVQSSFERPNGRDKKPTNLKGKPQGRKHNWGQFLRGVEQRPITEKRKVSRWNPEAETFEDVQEDEVVGYEDILTQPESALEGLSELFAQVRIDIYDFPDRSKSWSISFEFEDESGIWSYTEHADGRIEGWAKLENPQ